MTPQKVQIFALGQSAKDVPKGKRRFYVRWRIDGRDRDARGVGGEEAHLADVEP